MRRAGVGQTRRRGRAFELAGAELDQRETALGQHVEHRGGLLAAGKAPASAGQRGVSRGARQHPVQALQVLLGRVVGQQRVRPRIARGIVRGLHRQIQQHLVSGATRPLDQGGQVGRIGRELQADRSGQCQSSVEQLGPQPEPQDHDRDLRTAILEIERSRVSEQGTPAVRADSGERPEGAVFDQRGVDRDRRSLIRVGRRARVWPQCPVCGRDGAMAVRVSAAGSGSSTLATPL